MKNAIVFSISKQRWAIELRWVREVITLGHVTPVPKAPPAFAGVVNFGGAIVAVIELLPLLPSGEWNPEAGTAVGGDNAILLQVESVHAALRVDAVIEVTTLRPAGAKLWADSRGLQAKLVDPQELVAIARAQVTAAGSGESETTQR